MTTTTTTPRERLRSETRRGGLALGRALVLLALVEAFAAPLRALFDPGATPVVLVHLATALRFAATTFAFLAAGGLVASGRLLGLGLVAELGRVLLGLSALASVLPLFDLVPEALGDALWDTLLHVLRLATALGGLALLLLVAREAARRERLPRAAARLGRALTPVLVAAPVGLAAIDPGLLPYPFIAPALALALPVTLAALRLLRWDLALWATIGLVTVGGLLAFELDPLPPLALPAVAMFGVALLGALAASGALHELAHLLAGRDPDGPSATFIRRLFEGSLGGEASRVGDLDPAKDGPPDASTDPEASLALAYRELGITAPTPPRPPVPPDELPPAPAVVLPFVPKSREQSRPADAPPGEVVSLPVRPHAGPHAARHVRGLRLIARALLARLLVLVFGGLLLQTPLGDALPLQLAFDLGVLATSVALALGLHTTFDLDGAPSRAARAAGWLCVALELAAMASRLAPTLPRAALMAAATLALFASLALLLWTLARVFRTRREDKLTRRAHGALALLSGFASSIGALAFVRALDASDLAWLAWPIGLAAVGLGLGLWLSLQWLLRDARDVIDPSAPLD